MMKYDFFSKKQFKISNVFAVSGIFLFLIISLSFGFIYKTLTKDYLITMEQERAINFTQLLANSLSYEIERVIEDGKYLTSEELNRMPLVTTINDDIKKNIAGLNTILKIKIFTIDRKTVFSTDKSELGEIKNSSYGGIDSASRIGKIVSKIEFEEKTNTIFGVRKNVFVLSSYLPLTMPVTHKVFGVIEVYSDLTVALKNISKNSNILMGISSLLFIFIIFVIYLILRKAEYISSKQAKIIQENQTRLIATSKLASIGELAGGIAHEINNPLMIIHGYAEQLKDNIKGEEFDSQNAIHDLDTIIQTSSRIAIIVGSLKKLGNQRQTEELSEYLVVDIINEAIELCRMKFHIKGIELKLQNIPSNLKIYCRPVGVSQVFINLLNNSFDAITHIEKPWVEIKASVKGKMVEIEFIDCGTGIEKALVDKIMDPYFTTKDVGRGTGLGLSISQRIIEDQDGKLFLDANRKNTTFVIHLPLAQ